MRRDNPFEPLSTASLAAIYEWPGEAVRFLEGACDCLHIVGECGMGKTALLRQIEARFASALYACVPLGGEWRLQLPAGVSVALLDETDRLTGRALGQAVRTVREARARCVLAAHRSQLRGIRRAGLSAELIELRPITEAARVRRLWEARVALAYGDEGARLSDEAAQALLSASRGNVERCLQIGYEVFEDLEALRPITADDIAAAAASLDRALAVGGVSR
jgi:hypothetical protein